MNNTKRNLKYDIFVLMLALFLSIVIVDPTNKLFQLKEIAFLFMIAITIILQMGKWYKYVVSSYMILFFLALISICFGTLIYSTELSGSLSYFKALLFGLIFFPLSKLDALVIIKLGYRIGLALAIFISIMLLSFVGGFIDLSGIIGKMTETETIMVARRDLLGFEVLMFFYKTMPFLFFALIYSLRKKYFLSVPIILLPIIYGGSRTPMLMALMVIAYVLYERKNKYIRLFIGISAIFGLLYLLHILTSSTYSQGGDEIKAGVASYLLDNTSFWGHGVGAKYWDPARGQFTTTTEMTYFEMLYQYGWLLSPFVLIIFFMPFLVMFKKSNNVFIRDFAIAYLLYLVNAGTNPLLISSTGMYVFACALTLAAKVNKHEKYICAESI